MQDQKTPRPLSRSQETAAALIAERCFKDKAFGEKFLADPKAALAEQGVKTSPQRQVHVHENDAHNWHIVLPHFEARELLNKYTDEEVAAMSDADLQRIAGGEIVGSVAAVALVSGIIGTGTAVGVTGAVVGGHYGAKKKK